MKPKIKFSSNALKIYSGKWPSLLFFNSGMVVLGAVSIIYIGQFYISASLLHIGIGLGLCLVAAGFLVLLKYKAVNLTVNSSRGILVIKNSDFLRQTVTTFPLSHFSRILILENLTLGKQSEVNKSFQVSLYSEPGSYLLLRECHHRSDALVFVEKLRQILLLDVYYLNELYKKSDFNQKTDDLPEEIEYARQSDLKVIQKESEIRLKWKERHNLWFAIFMLVIGYACIELVLGLSPLLRFSPWSSPMLIVSGVMIFAVLLVSGLRISRTTLIRLGRESVRYYLKVLGFQIESRQMNWDDVTELVNSLTARNLKIISNIGCEILEELTAHMQEDRSDKFDEDIMSKLEAVQNEVLAINVGSLDVSDRYRIEQEIFKFML